MAADTGKKKDKGGRLAANFRRANLAEGVAIQLLRPFAAVAPVPREEDYGLDLIGTLLRRDGRVLVAEDSFVVQVKTRTAAEFGFEGDGLRWLRELPLPYLPVVMDIDAGRLFLYTINEFRMPLHAAAIDRMNFTIDGDGPDDFPLGDPLLSWSFSDATHPDFPAWAYSVLKPAIRLEALALRHAALRRFIAVVGGPYSFEQRGADGRAVDPPRRGRTFDVPPANTTAVLEALQDALTPFAYWVGNRPVDGLSGGDLIELRACFRRLGLDPDPDEVWEEIAREMA